MVEGGGGGGGDGGEGISSPRIYLGFSLVISGWVVIWEDDE